MERLTAAFDLKSAELDGVFKGRALVYGREFQTMFGPLIIEPGAFRESIQKNGDRLVILWQHNQDEPVGRPINIEDRPDGVHITGKLSLTNRGRDALTLLRDRVVRELSAGVERLEEVEAKGKTTRLKRGELHEISLVTFGAAGREGAKVYEVNKRTAQATDAGQVERQIRDFQAVAHHQLAKLAQPSHAEARLVRELLAYLKSHSRLGAIEVVWFHDASDDLGRTEVALASITGGNPSVVSLRTGLDLEDLGRVVLHELGHVACRHRSAGEKAEREAEAFVSWWLGDPAVWRMIRCAA